MINYYIRIKADMRQYIVSSYGQKLNPLTLVVFLAIFSPFNKCISNIVPIHMRSMTYNNSSNVNIGSYTFTSVEYKVTKKKANITLIKIINSQSR